MARRVKDATLDTSTARRKLKPRGKPYYRTIERGLHLGYRKLSGGATGTWVARHYVGEQQYEVERIGTADDVSDADKNPDDTNNSAILDFWQAQEKARRRMSARTKTGNGTTGAPVTVAQAVQDYITERDKRESKRAGRVVRSDAQRLRRYVLGQDGRGKGKAIDAAPLAAITLHALDDTDLMAWRIGLPERLKGATRQRITNDLKAALNSAYQSRRKQLPASLPSAIEYGLKAEIDEDADVGVRDNQILSDAEVKRLLRAAQEIDVEQGWDGDLFRLVVMLAATGARYSQIVRMRVRDCQVANGRLLVPFSRKGKGRSGGSTPIPVGQDTLAALAPIMGRAAGKPLLERWRRGQADGGQWARTKRRPWAKSDLTSPWQDIRERAGMPEVIPYALRHSSIVRGIRANLPIRLVAALHDTSVQMIERHYSRWIVDGLEEMAAKAIVPLVPQSKGAKILPIGRK